MEGLEGRTISRLISFSNWMDILKILVAELSWDLAPCPQGKFYFVEMKYFWDLSACQQ